MKSEGLKGVFFSVVLWCGGLEGRAATVLWTNLNGGNWNVAANWSPNQVPGASDSAIVTNNGTYSVTVNVNSEVTNLIVGAGSGTQTLAFASSTLTLDGASSIEANGVLALSGGALAGAGLTISSTMNWTGGTLNNGAALTIAPGAVLNLSGAATKSLFGALTNAGTIYWTGSGNLLVYNNNGANYHGAIYNLAGALFSIQNDQPMSCVCYGFELFNNSGTVTKSGATGTTTLGVPFNNTGILDVQSGTIVLTGGGTATGSSFGVESGATLQFSSTYNASSSQLSGAGTNVITSGTVAFSGAVGVSNVVVSGGTFAPSGEVGVTALALSGGGLGGASTVLGTMNWTGGTLNNSAALTIASGAVLNFSGAATKSIFGAVTNAGTIYWTGTGGLLVYNNNGGNYRGAIYNLAGALFSIQNDQPMSCVCYGFELFNNSGTVTKSGATGTTTLGVPFNNTGTLDVQSGTVVLGGGGSATGGSFGVESGATLQFSGAYNGPSSQITGAGVISITTGSVNLGAVGVPSAVVSGGTFTFASGTGFSNVTVSAGTFAPSSNVGITALALSGGGLGGTSTVLGTMNWTAGALNNGAALTIAPGAVLNLSGAATKSIFGALTNAGTIYWTGSGNLLVYNNNGANYRGAIYNLSGALFSIQNDQPMSCVCYGFELFNNSGTVTKSGATGTTTLGVPFNNTGTLDVQSGTVVLGGGGTGTGASFGVESGATLQFSTTYNASSSQLTGAGTNVITGGTITFSGAVGVSNVVVSGGTFAPSGNVGVTALALSGGGLGGASTVLGTMNWTGGTLNNGAALNIASGAVLNLSGAATKSIFGALTNAGTIYWTGTGSLLVYNNNGGNYSGGIANLSGALFSIQNDQPMGCVCYGHEFFNNAGTLRKSAATGTTTIQTPFNNLGALDIESGLVSFTGVYTNSGGALGLVITNVSAYGRLSFGSALAMTGTLNVSLGSSYQPSFGDAFTLLTYPSRTGAFSYNLPSGTQWQITNGLTALTITALGALATTNTYTWTGAASSDWFTPSNWSPPGVPGYYDTVNFGSGAIGLSSAVTIGGQFNWSGGTLSGSPLIIASNGVMNVNGIGNKYLQNALTNNGTVNWAPGGGGFYVQNNNTAANQGAIYNQAGALWRLETDQSISAFYSTGYEAFNNAGTVQKSATSGTSVLGVALYNTGLMDAETGAISINGGGALGGAFNAAAGAAITFSGGGFVLSAAPVATGAGQVGFGGSAQILFTAPITGFNLNGGTLISTSIVSGAMTWSGGAIAGPLTVAGSGTLNIVGGTEALQNVLTNEGTVTLSGSGNLVVYNDNSTYKGGIYNLAGALCDLQSDRGVACACRGSEFFSNAGTLRKSAGSGISSIGVAFANNGSVDAQTGTISFANGGSLGGSFGAASGAAIAFAGGTFSFSAAPTLTGPGAIQFTGGNLTLLSDAIPNLQMVAGTIALGPGFQGGTITNLNLAGAVLSGNYTVSGILTCGGGVAGSLVVNSGGAINWNGGTISGGLTESGGAVVNWSAGTMAGPLNVSSNAVLNITAGPAYLQNALTNSGTVTMSGSGTFQVQNNGGSLKGSIYSLAGALWSFESDRGINCSYCTSLESFSNAGTVRKTAGPGSSTVGLAFYNTGLVDAETGTLVLNNGGTLGGAFNAAAGAAVAFSGGTFVLNAAPAATGAGQVGFSGNAQILFTAPIASFTLGGGTLISTNIVTGTMTWSGGAIAGPLTVAGSAALNIVGGTEYLQNVLTNAGAVTMSGSGSFSVQNNGANLKGAIYNLPGGLWNIQSDRGLSCFNCNSLELFNNAGTLEKTGGAGSSTIGVVFGNTGLVDAETGTLAINAGGALGGTFVLSAAPAATGAGQVGFSGNAQILFTAPITSFTLGGGTLLSTSVISGTMTWSGGTIAAPLTIASNAVLNITGGAEYLENALTNSGTVTLSGSGTFQVQNNNAALKGAIYNLGGGVWDIQSDRGMSCYSCNGSEVFNNAGTLQKTGGSGASSIALACFNTGTLGLFSGAINFSSANSYTQADAVVDFGVAGAGRPTPLVVNGAVRLDGTLLANLLNNYAPASGDTIPLISCGTLSGSFNLLNLPAAGNGRAWQVAYAANSVSLQVISNGNFNAQIMGSVTDGSSAPVSNMTVYAFTTNSGSSVFLSTLTDGSGSYALNVSNGVWNVGLAGLVDRGYANLPPQTVVVGGASQTLNFVLEPYSGPSFAITVSAQPPGGGGATGGGVFLPGSTVTLTATPNTNPLPYYFTGWTENALLLSTNDPYVFLAQRSQQIAANFTLPTFTVSVSNSPPGAGSASGAGAFFYGDTNVLVAHPNFGYYFGAWTENGSVVGAGPSLSTIVNANHVYVANYLEANTNHYVLTATQPPGLATVTGAGLYTNGQTAMFSAPTLVVSPPYDYFFQKFVLTNLLVSASANFSKSFSTIDPTNLLYTAVYASLGVVPVVTNVTANYPSPVPGTTNFQIAFHFDRTMDTNFTPQIALTNSGPGAAQPVVPAGGRWSSFAVNNDTFAPPPITLTQPMSGTIQVYLSGAQDPLGVPTGLTNVDSFVLDATPPVLGNIAATPSALTAYITWNSDKPASSLVEYGAAAAYGSTSGLYAQLVTTHGITLSGLSPQTTYHYRVRSRDLAGNETLSADNALTTLAAPDLQVSSLSVAGNLASGGNLLVSWMDTNSGSGPTFTYWFDLVTVTNSTGQTIFNSGPYHDPGASGNIAAGDGRARSFQVQLPNGVSGAGNLGIAVTVNAYRTQYEGNGGPNPYANNSAALSVTSALAAYPDLQITGLAITNSQLQSGSRVGLVWNDANTGNGSAGNVFYDQVLVVNQTSGQTLLNSALASTPPIAPGQAAARQFLFALPDGTPGVGNLRITVTADYYNSVFEYNTNGTGEVNNSTSISGSSTLAPYPDLMVANVTGPASASAGQAIQVTWTESNLGTAPATNAWTDQIFLADDLTQTSVQLLGSLTLPNGLAAGQAVTNTQTVTLPLFGTGNKWLVVKADAGNAIFELIKTNNIGLAAQPITLGATLSLSISPSTFVQNAALPAALATLTRSGNTSSNLVVVLNSSDPSSATVPASVTIPAGQSAATFPVNAVPSNLVRGTRLVTVSAVADGYPGATKLLTVLDNNVPTLSVGVGLASVGESFTQPIACAVNRNTTTNTPLTVSLVTSDRSKLTVPVSVTIPAGAWSAPFNASVLSNALPTVDALISVLASASGYASVAGTITVTDDDLPPLSLTLADSFITENAANPASQGTVTCKSPSPFPITIVLQSDSPRVGLPPTVTLAANQTSAIFPINVLNDHLVHGPVTATLRAFTADPLVGTPIAATGATNSIVVIDDNGPALSLSLASSTISDTGLTIATVRCNFTPNTNLVVTLASTDADTATVPPTATILAGQTSASFTVSGVNPGVPTGPRRATVTASAAGFATGVANLSVSDVNLPDLRVTGITLPATALASAITNVSYSVVNDGIWAATNSWTDYIYYSSSRGGANPTYVGQVRMTNALAIGQAYTNAVRLFLPPNPGQYYLAVNVNPAQTLAEISYQNNNLVSGGFIDVQPDYRATVSADIPTAPSGTPIRMHGYAFSALDSAQSVPFVPVSIRVLVKGIRRVFTVTTDANGNFVCQFVPLANEAGNYQLCADNPAVTADTIQSGFALYGIRFADSGLIQSLYPNTGVTGQVMVQNLGDLPLTGLSSVVEGATTNLSVQLGLSNSIPAGSTVPLAYTFLAGNVSSPIYIRARIHATSAEGAVAYYPLTFTIAPQTAVLSANPNSLVNPMLRGAQTFVSFDLVNSGGVASGPIQMLLPQAPWLAAASGTNLPSLGPGQTNRVTLSLTPAPDLALQPYTGAISFVGANTSLSLPIDFRAISAAIGDVRVTVQDDYTFYVAGAPLVTNATVTLTDPYANTVVASSLTGSNGIVLLNNISEGSYQLTVTADRHNSFKMPITVLAGQTNQITAFIARQTVTYQWTVVPTEIPDTYRIQLESVFETEVPIPVVTIDNPRLIPLVIPGEDTHLEIRVSNHGLIAAQGVQLNLPTSDQNHEYIALATNIDTIPAMSSISIPIIVRARTNASGIIAKGFSTDCPSIPKCNLKWGFICGKDMNWHAVEAELVPVDVDKDCAELLEDLLKDEIDELKKAKGDWKELMDWSQLCKVTDILEQCLGLNKCVVAALRSACGLTSLSFSTTLNGALGFASCFCYHFEFSDDPPTGPDLPPIGGGVGGSGGAGDPGIITSPPSEGVFSGCTPGQQLGNPTGSIVAKTGRILIGQWPVSTAGTSGGTSTSAPIANKSTTSPGAVCAQVRISIDQQAVVARAAFLGTLTIDNGDPGVGLTNVQVSIDIRDVNQNPANDMFGINGPVLSQLTATDGTGMLAPGASGSAKFTFVPTHNAAPAVPTIYKIGGTLQYYQNDSLVQVPLLPEQITVFPDPVLRLLYFQQRDVYADDPFTPDIEPSEPFDLGLMVKNSGYGKAFNFTITSGQPKIVDNQKGLLINFNIIGTKIGSNSITPSLTANLGEIDPGQTKVATWEMLSSLQGRFIEYKATFQHVDNLGNPQTSLIDGVEIHQLIHTVLANRPGDDSIPDFLANDIPNPDNLPDTLYLSDGTTTPVNVVTNGTFDAPVSAGHLQVLLHASVGNGWNYLQLPDPGASYILQAVVRSDGKMLAPTNDAWTTDRSFPSAIAGAVREHLVHLFDYAGSGTYTLFYHSTNTVSPAIFSLGPVSPFNQASTLSSVTIVFSEPVAAATFMATNLSLALNGGPNLIPNNAAVTLTLLSNATYSINGLAPYSAADGNYQLTVTGKGILDLWGNDAGSVSASTQWAKGNVAPVVQSISPVAPNPRNTPVTSLTVTFSKDINPASLNYQALSLNRDGGPNLVSSDVTITAQSSNSFTINGLGPLTGAQGGYVLSVNAAAVQDTNGTAGLGSQSVSWSTITTGPIITGLEPITTNPRNIVVRTLNVVFSEPIAPASFDYNALTLTLNGGPNLVTSDVTITRLDPLTFQVGNINWLQGYAGTYSFTVNAASVTDLAGNAGAGGTNETWRMILESPPAPANLFIAPDLGISSTDGLTSTNSVTLFGTVAATNLIVRVVDGTTASDLGTTALVGTNFSAPLSFTTAGQHHLQVTAADVAGNVSPQSVFNLFLDFVPPTAVIQQVSNPAYSAVSTIPVSFSKSINTNTISPANFVVTFNGTNQFTPSLTTLTASTFLLGNLASFTAAPGAYQVTLRLAGIQDYAANTSTNSITMTWANGNLPPVVAPLTNMVVSPGATLAFQLAASDPRGFPLVYSLAADAPAGASIDPTNGMFAWTPACGQGGTTNPITIWVLDQGSPALSNSVSLLVTVRDCLQVSVGSSVVQTGRSACLPLNLLSTVSLTNLSFTLDCPGDRFTNWMITATNPSVATASAQVLDGSHTLFTLLTKPGQALQGPLLPAWICLTALPGISGFVPVNVESITGITSDGSLIGTTFGQSGRVAVIASQPVLEASLGPNLARLLTLYGNPGASYEVDYATNLLNPNWRFGWRVPMTNLFEVFAANVSLPQVYYRAFEFSADPPILELNSPLPSNLVLLVYGQKGNNYAIISGTNLLNTAGWSPFVGFTLTNSFQFIPVGAATNRMQFFRAKPQ